VFARIAQGILDLLYPPQCEICGGQLLDTDRYICNACNTAIPVISSPRCPRCSRPIHTRNGSDQLCGVCRLQKRPAVSRVIAGAEYPGSVQHLIHQFKYRRRQYLAPVLTDIICRNTDLPDVLTETDWLVPIPLHWTRTRWRGFNQAWNLARLIGKRYGTPVLSKGVFKRVRRTTPQVQLNVANRATNIKGAFKVCRPAVIDGKRLALVDDVLTTGSTAKECARTLRRAGAANVSLIVIAR
jgi:ComF family protein